MKNDDYEDPQDDGAERRRAMQDALNNSGDTADGGYDPGNPPPTVEPGSLPPPDVGVTDPKEKAPSPTLPPAGTPGGPAATNPDGSQVGAGLPWDPKTGAPSGSVPGYHWDATYASWMKDATPAAVTPSGGPPTGGALTDPNYAAQFVAYWGNQPGTNPSVKNDPNYWIGRFTSGAFGNDQQYAIQRMFQPEGAPEGSGGQTRGPVAPNAQGGGTYGSTISAPQLPGFPSNDQFGQNIRNQILALLNQAPVDENDPDIRGAISANRVAQERALDEEKNQIAESAYAQHLGGAGSTGASYQAARERTGASEGQFAGNLVAQQALSRRNQITQILQIGAGVMTADQQQQLQRELANLDAILRQQSITNQNNQANDRLGFDIGSFQANMNRNAVLDAMGVHL